MDPTKSLNFLDSLHLSWLPRQSSFVPSSYHLSSESLQESIKTHLLKLACPSFYLETTNTTEFETEDSKLGDFPKVSY